MGQYKNEDPRLEDDMLYDGELQHRRISKWLEKIDQHGYSLMCASRHIAIGEELTLPIGCNRDYRLDYQPDWNCPSVKLAALNAARGHMTAEQRKKALLRHLEQCTKVRLGAKDSKVVVIAVQQIEHQLMEKIRSCSIACQMAKGKHNSAL